MDENNIKCVELENGHFYFTKGDHVMNWVEKWGTTATMCFQIFENIESFKSLEFSQQYENRQLCIDAYERLKSK